MSYGRVKKPKIYHDLVKYLLAVDWLDPADILFYKQTSSTFGWSTSAGTPTFSRGNKLELFDGKPTNFSEVASANKKFAMRINTKFTSNSLAETSYVAILNHNFRDSGVELSAFVNDSDTNASLTSVNKIVSASSTIYGSGVVAGSIGSQYVDYDSTTGTGYENGWTIIEYPTATTDNQYLYLFFTPSAGYNQNFTESVKMGSILFGESLQFPNSVDMKMKHKIDYTDGLVRHRSVGGNEYITASHFGSPTWVAGLPWQNTSTSGGEDYYFQQRYGRKSYEFNMSYLSDENLYSSDSSSPSPSDWFDSNSFHQLLYNRTLGGSIPFIMNVDSGNASPPDDSFGYYRLNKNILEANQVAHRTFNLDFKIEETF